MIQGMVDWREGVGRRGEGDGALKMGRRGGGGGVGRGG